MSRSQGVALVAIFGVALGCAAERPVFTEAPATTVIVPPTTAPSRERPADSPVAEDASEDVPLADDGMGGDVGTSPPTPSFSVPSSLGSTPRAISAARDSRVKTHPPRNRGMMVTELQGLTTLLSSTPPNAPDRPTLIRRIAEDYAELERAVITASGPMDPLARSARTKAIDFYTQLEGFPTYPKLDEALYFKGLELEMGGYLTNARRAYLDLIRKSPQSKLVSAAYFAFGEMFFDEAAADASKLDLALQAYNEVLKQPASVLAPESLLRSAQIAERKGDRSRALGLYKRLLQLHPGTTAASAVPAWARVP